MESLDSVVAVAKGLKNTIARTVSSQEVWKDKGLDKKLKPVKKGFIKTYKCTIKVKSYSIGCTNLPMVGLVSFLGEGVLGMEASKNFGSETKNRLRKLKIQTLILLLKTCHGAKILRGLATV